MRERRWMARAQGAVLLLLLFLAALIAGALLRRHRPVPKRAYLMAAFLDVGGGDCTLIRTPHGRVILVDTGPADAQPQLIQALRQQKIETVDLLVLASDSPASISGLSPLLTSGITIRQAWICPGLSPTDTKLAPLRAGGIEFETVHAGGVFSDDGATLTALWPPPSAPSSADASLACRLDFGATGFVLAAPLDAPAARRLVGDVGAGLDCDVLLVPDGGVDGATTPELLRRAMPSLAVISCASPPGALTLRRLHAAGAVICRTDTDGAITIFTDGVTPPIVKDKPLQ